MAGMNGLGRVFNVVGTADTVEVSLKDASAVTFMCVGDEAYTVDEMTDAAGTGSQNLAVVDLFYKAPPGGTAVWEEVTQTASATVDPNDATNTVVVFTVTGSQLSDGFDYVSVTAASAGLVTAITHDLTVQRAPENLPALGV